MSVIMIKKLPSSVYNWITITGVTISTISFFMIVFLFVVSFFLDKGGSYLGLVIYIILPSFLILGLILIPIGMYKKSKADKRSGIPKEFRFPKIDLNDIKHRNAFFIFISVTAVFLLVSAVGSYEAFNYTESTEFCGTLCHSVMSPEYTAYQGSAHARVRCVDCHVGSGAGWYVRSKLSGLYQVYAVISNTYPRPIETPISNLRPARETCEECHWPEKFYSRKLVSQKHYLADEINSEWDISMSMKIGPTYSALGLNEGIHWHINPNVKIEYITTDKKNQVIPWVKYTNLKTGEVHIYNDSNDKLEPGAFDSLKINVMDCIDCHNRPSHSYLPPAFFIDNALTAGKIPKELPEIKKLSMEILENEFGTTDSAMIFIRETINKFYADNYPEINKTNYNRIEKAVTGLQNEFKKNIFPEMKVRWSAYPNNIGHVEFDGCFRCHSDSHTSDKGRNISRDCNLCHSIIAQGPPENLIKSVYDEGLEFKHPVDIDEMWKETNCTACHTGLAP
jgi:hypothetical protein